MGLDNFGNVKVAKDSSAVYKEECVLSFDTPFTPGGLYTNLSTFESFGDLHLADDIAQTKQQVYLHQQFVKTGVKKQVLEQVSKVAIGVEGGFNDDEVEVTKTLTVVVFQGDEKLTFELTDPSLPAVIRDSVESVLNHQGHHVSEQVKSWQEEIATSQYAFDLIQLPKEDCAPISGNPSTWVCGSDTCDKKENLWMNLSDGYLGCGRRNFDGSGGCGEALRHFEATGRNFPLAVKLGTITPAGGGDVYSYAEDDMVRDPNLAAHLRHFGIKVDELTKTEKTINELTVELNKNWDFDSIMEEGKDLEPISGPGYIGLVNLGNSCYVNSVLQLLVTLPEVQERYLRGPSRSSSTPATDVSTQFAKLVKALHSERYVAEELRPLMLRSVVGKDHADFSSNRQQDAMEYLQHLLSVLDAAEAEDTSTSPLFAFTMEDRLECLTSQQVRYVCRRENVLQLGIPLDAATNADQVQEFKRQKLETDKAMVPDVPFDACLHEAFSPELFDGFYSSALGRKGPASKTSRFNTFPKYLLVQMQRYYVSEDWTPKKMDVSVVVPETLDLTPFRSTGKPAHEVLLPDDTTISTPAQPDAALVAELVAMGFSENGCKRAALATANASTEVAMDWILTHMEDADFNSPVAPTAAASSSTSEPSEDLVHNLTMMGFSQVQAKCALEQTGHNADAAADWLLSHMDDLEIHVRDFERRQAATPARACGHWESQSTAHYELLGFVSHMGSNTHSGHYVAHIKKNGKWIFFNDAKVAVSDTPPFGAGYIYLYRRRQSPPTN
ncbi:hypothetical protein DYB37_001323 [Aphanomyces astaci]|uniref:Ubiquitin carboxyl-terminal hydrolase n=1 Tax=Aphanomyces astaci TaxID=112090 RepID=A0A3R7BTZ8_APHAT|nr:hypothetical protein DYB35_001215 [Aphanomyces astaci]RHZ23252.1 hypothetical protein DYB37_001323 [Aphanomyces astaci]